MTDQLAICADQLTKRYDRTLAVDAVSFEVLRGEVFGFLGPNGAGKTTTIAMLLGLVTPTSGRAVLLGHDIQQAPAAALQRVGSMIEAPAFYPYLSGHDNLRLLTRAAGLPPARVEAALAAVELTEHSKSRYATYSQGMKQRLAIAATLLNDPEVIILDEPTNGLDPAGTVEIRALIRRLAAAGRTIFLCSHVLHEVEQVCSRVAILKRGKLLAVGPVSALLQRSRHVRLRVAGDPQAALALLQKQAAVRGVVRQGDTLIVDTALEQAPVLNALLVRNDVPVCELRTESASLEEVFLEITGQAE